MIRIRTMWPVFFLFSITLSGCGMESYEELVRLDPDDLLPPEIQEVAAVGSRTLEVRFDKEAWLEGDSFVIAPSLDVAGVEDGSKILKVLLAEDGRAGVRYSCEATVRDAKGNSLSFLYHFYGFNERVPRLLINEFITSASSTVSTMAEIVVLADGNMGGVAFFEGTKSFFDKAFVFPSLEVRSGDFILLHFKPSGAEGETDELSAKDEAAAKGSSPVAWDFWARDTGNLSEDNDVLSLYDNPEGRLLDGVLYSTKVYAEGMKYNGFGTSLMLSKVKELVAGGGWKTAADEPYPRDGVNSDAATSTRSICRGSSSGDTDAAADWHVVPTKKSSFGAVNSDEVYAP